MKCAVRFGRIVAHKKLLFFSWQLENKLFKLLFIYEWTTAEFTGIGAHFFSYHKACVFLIQIEESLMVMIFFFLHCSGKTFSWASSWFQLGFLVSPRSLIRSHSPVFRRLFAGCSRFLTGLLRISELIFKVSDKCLGRSPKPNKRLCHNSHRAHLRRF